MTVNSTRQRILGYLGQHRGATSTEISLALGLTAANIRHHLAILLADGRVVVKGFRPDRGRGRPVKIFELGETAGRENLANLASALLTYAYGKSSEVERAKMLEVLAEILSTGIDSPTGHITRRLAQTVGELSKRGYMARWEAHAAAPMIIFENCPYQVMIAEHPVLCQVDRLILEKCLSASAEQIAKLEKNARGLNFCQFAVWPRQV